MPGHDSATTRVAALVHHRAMCSADVVESHRDVPGSAIASCPPSCAVAIPISRTATLTLIRHPHRRHPGVKTQRSHLQRELSGDVAESAAAEAAGGDQAGPPASARSARSLASRSRRTSTGTTATGRPWPARPAALGVPAEELDPGVDVVAPGGEGVHAPVGAPRRPGLEVAEVRPGGRVGIGATRKAAARRQNGSDPAGPSGSRPRASTRMTGAATTPPGRRAGDFRESRGGPDRRPQELQTTSAIFNAGRRPVPAHHCPGARR